MCVSRSFMRFYEIRINSLVHNGRKRTIILYLYSLKILIHNSLLFWCQSNVFISDKVTKEKAELFEDVTSSFSSVKEILSRFELWKFGFSESYKDAYMGICIPKLLAPFVKLELLLWNPLEVFLFIAFKSLPFFINYFWLNFFKNENKLKYIWTMVNMNINMNTTIILCLRSLSC